MHGFLNTAAPAPFVPRKHQYEGVQAFLLDLCARILEHAK